MYIYVISIPDVRINVMVVIRIPDIPHTTLEPTHTIMQSQTISIQIRNSQMVITEAQRALETTNIRWFSNCPLPITKVNGSKNEHNQRFKGLWGGIEQLLLFS